MTKEEWVEKKSLEIGGILLKGFVFDREDPNMLFRCLKNCNERMILWLRKTYDEMKEPTGK